MKILGLDIGGANVKAGLIDVSNGKVSEHRSVVKYLPLWKDGKEKLSKIIQEVSKSIANSRKYSLSSLVSIPAKAEPIPKKSAPAALYFSTSSLIEIPPQAIIGKSVISLIF